MTTLYELAGGAKRCECGIYPELRTDPDLPGIGGVLYYYICRLCELQTNEYEKQDSACIAWNREITRFKKEPEYKAPRCSNCLTYMKLGCTRFKHRGQIKNFYRYVCTSCDNLGNWRYTRKGAKQSIKTLEWLKSISK